MEKPVIPPSRPDGDSPAHITMELLQRRLQAAEGDTKSLVQQLADLGFRPEGKSPEIGAQSIISPYHPRFADTATLQRNYENLVSRVCKTESILQTLKLNMVNLQAQAELHKKDSMSANEKLAHAKDSFERDKQKLTRELVRTNKELKEAIQNRNAAEDQVRRIQHALEIATSNKADEGSKMDDLTAAKHKLSRRVSELREELARETNLRASLEDSHNSLLSRIKDMEAIVESEREEVKALSSNCTALRRESMRSKEELQRERQLRLQFEKSIEKINTNYEVKSAQVESVEEDKKMLVGQLSKISGQYVELNKQLEAMQSLFEEHRGTHSQLEHENRQLHEALKTAASGNAKVIQKYEEQLESERKQWEGKVQDSDNTIFLKEEMRQLNKDKDNLEQKNSQLQKELLGAKRTVADKDRESKETSSDLGHEVNTLRQQLTIMQEEKTKALSDKEALLDEVNQAVDSMTEERTRLQTELHEGNIEIQAMKQSKLTIEQENARLLERMGALEQQQATQQHIDKAMADMLEQKNKLAYDNGRLQTKLEQLHSELESLGNVQTELAQLRKLNASLESKYAKTQGEMSAYKINIQRLENQVKQTQICSDRKETDFNMAIQARDEAVRETQKLMGHIEAMEEREKQRIQTLQQSLTDSKDDNKKVAGTLESVMTSHNQLQLTVEKLQMELGRRDSQISQLKHERQQTEHAMRKMNKEVELLQNKLLAMETLEASEVEPLREALEQCKCDNSHIAASLEGVLSSNSQLQGSLQRLQDELEEKTHQLVQLRENRDLEYNSMKEDLCLTEEKLEMLKQEMRKERDKSMKKNNKEVAEVKRQHDNLLAKNGDLSRANSELRQRISEEEHRVKELKDRISSLKSQIDNLSRVKKEQEQNLQRMKGINREVEELDRVKQEYVKKNAEQARTINSFVAQIETLQLELKNIARSQTEMVETIQSQEAQLEEERQKYGDLKAKYNETKMHEQNLEDLRRKTEEKLLEANNESMQISSSLQDAHEWFKSKFEHLQAELIRSRKTQAELENVNYEQRQAVEEEKRRAQEIAGQARQMLKASRLSVNKLADFAEKAQGETKEHISFLKNKLDREENHVHFVDQKYNRLQESSSRQLEALIEELEEAKRHQSIHDFYP